MSYILYRKKKGENKEEEEKYKRMKKSIKLKETVRRRRKKKSQRPGGSSNESVPEVHSSVSLLSFFCFSLLFFCRKHTTIPISWNPRDDEKETTPAAEPFPNQVLHSISIPMNRHWHINGEWVVTVSNIANKPCYYTNDLLRIITIKRTTNLPLRGCPLQLKTEIIFVHDVIQLLLHFFVTSLVRTK